LKMGFILATNESLRSKISNDPAHNRICFLNYTNRIVKTV